MNQNPITRPGRVNGWVIVVLVASVAAIAQAFGRFSYGVLFPAIRDDLQISNTVASLLGASNVGAYLIGTIAVALTTSRFGLLATFRVGMLLATLGLGIAAMSSGPLLLALGLGIAGFGGACVWIPAPAIAADAIETRHRNLAVGLMGSGMGAGIVFVSLLTASVRTSVGDAAWSQVYQIQAVLAVVIVVAAGLLVSHVQTKPAGGGVGFGALRRMSGWLPLIIAYGTFGFMYLLVVGFLTTRLEDDSGWATSDAAYTFTLMGVAMIFGGPLFVAITNRIGVRQALCIAFLLWPFLVMTILVGHPWLVLPAVVGLGLLFSAIPSLMTVYVVQNTTQEDYGPSFAAATLAFGIAQVISPPVGGFIADVSGSFLLVFLLSAFMGSFGFFTVWRLPRTSQS